MALEKNSSTSIFEGMCVRRQEINISQPKTSSVIFSEPTDGGQLYPAAKIFGEPIDPSCLHGIIDCTITPPVRTMHELHHSCIVGNSSVMDGESRLYFPNPVGDATTLLACKAAVDNNHHGYFLQGGEERAEIIYISRQSPRYIPLRVIFLHNLEPGNFGSFLIRQLPQLSLIADLQTHVDAYVVPERTSWFRDAIELFGLPDLPAFTVREVCGDIFKTIILPGSLDAEGYSSPLSRSKILDRVTTRLGRLTAANPKKIYVSRLLSEIARPHYRVLSNESEVVRIVSDIGFQIVYPETLSFKNQIETFRSAECIVGPSGSGMLNTFFSDRRPVVLDLESWTPNVRQHAKVYASAASTYGFLFGQTIDEPNRPIQVRGWRVDTELLNQALIWMGEIKTCP